MRKATKSKPERWTRDDLRSALGEGFHAAFRKAIDGHRSSDVWRIIDQMPDKEYRKVLDFVLSGLPDGEFVVSAAKGKDGAR